MPNELTRERSAFYHIANRSLTRADQEIYNTTVNSTGIPKEISEAYRQVLPFEHLKVDIDAWIVTNPNVIVKHDRVTLTELAGSNEQTWYIEADGERVTNFFTEQFLLDPATNTVPNGYVFELYRADGTQIPPSHYDWWVVPDEGLIRFEEGSTPTDLGIGPVTAIVYSGNPIFTAAQGVSGEPIFIGPELTDGTWMFIRDYNDNLDSYITNTTKQNNDRLQAYRYENGVYRIHVEFGESVHTDTYHVTERYGGYHLLNGDVDTMVMSRGTYGDDYLSVGSHTGRTGLLTQEPDSLYYNFGRYEPITELSAPETTSTLVYSPSQIQYVFSFDADDEDRFYEAVRVWPDVDGVHYRGVVTYTETGEFVFESSSEFIYELNNGPMTDMVETIISFPDPFRVAAGRAITLTVDFESPVGLSINPTQTDPDKILHLEVTYRIIETHKVVTQQHWLPEFKDVWITAGQKFHDYQGIICVKSHYGVYPLDIFDGNWSRIGDTSRYIFVGTEEEKLTRLQRSYSSGSFTEHRIDNGRQTGSTSFSDLDHHESRMFYDNSLNHVGPDTNGWLSSDRTLPPVVPSYNLEKEIIIKVNHDLVWADPDQIELQNQLADRATIIRYGRVIIQSDTAYQYSRSYDFLTSMPQVNSVDLAATLISDGKDIWVDVIISQYGEVTLEGLIAILEPLAVSYNYTGILFEVENRVEFLDDEKAEIDAITELLQGLKDLEDSIVNPPGLRIGIECLSQAMINDEGLRHSHDTDDNLDVTWREALMSIPISHPDLVDLWVIHMDQVYLAGDDTIRFLREAPLLDQGWYRTGFYEGFTGIPYEKMILQGTLHEYNSYSEEYVMNLDRWQETIESLPSTLKGISTDEFSFDRGLAVHPLTPTIYDFLDQLVFLLNQDTFVPEFQPEAPTTQHQRVWVDTGDYQSIGSMTYSNYHDTGTNTDRGARTVNVYVSSFKPSNTAGDLANTILVYQGDLEQHSAQDVVERHTIDFPSGDTQGRFLIVDISTNYGSPEYIGMRHITVARQSITVTTERPDNTAVFFYPEWGDNGNNQGIVERAALEDSDDTHGPTEWAVAEKEGFSTLHLISGLGLGDGKDFLVFEPLHDKVGESDWIMASAADLPTLHLQGSRLALTTYDPDPELTGDILYFTEYRSPSEIRLAIEDSVGNTPETLLYPRTGDIIEIVPDIGNNNIVLYLDPYTNDCSEFSVSLSKPLDNLSGDTLEIIIYNSGVEVDDTIVNPEGIVISDETYQITFKRGNYVDSFRSLWTATSYKTSSVVNGLIHVGYDTFTF